MKRKFKGNGMKIAEAFYGKPKQGANLFDTGKDVDFDGTSPIFDETKENDIYSSTSTSLNKIVSQKK